MFQNRLIPEATRLAGWAALVQDLSIQAPVRRPSCVSNKHVSGSQKTDGSWTVFDKRYWPGDEISDHLNFALRHESLDLLILKRAFEALDSEGVGKLEKFIRKAPTGISTRRAWYFFELLTGRKLDLPDAAELSANIAAVDLLDPKLYFTGGSRLSKRHRVRDNLLGTGTFCPVIRRTKGLEDLIALGLSDQAREVIGRTGQHLITRAASFLLLADSRASFEIEGERPPRNRLERWGRAVLQAGRNSLTLNEIIRLQGVVIEDARFVHPGLRPEGVFLGDRDPDGDPLPEFIGARPSDLGDLMNGLLDANDRMRKDAIDPVLEAAATAFAFVYVHPFQDGNGRVHRCLIHHVLSERGFTPPGLVFPVSSVMLDRIEVYRSTLRAHSGPLMDFIEWKPTPDRNVEVLNDTSDLYRYFDCTEAAEFLYACVRRTVEQDLPNEIDYLRRHEEASRKIMNIVEMPDRLAADLILFIRQNQLNPGTLPKKRRGKEFKDLTDEEVTLLEEVVREAFDGFNS